MTGSAPPSSPPRFDHRRDGTPATAWAPLRAALPTGADVGAHDHLLVLAAHPDDETLGAGGLIADAASAGARITVVVASDGEASHPDSPTLRPSELATIRRDEVRAAVRELAPDATVVFLHLPDGGLAHEVAALTDAVRRTEDHVTVLAAPWRGDGHPDHEACGAAAVAASTALHTRLLEYPIWGWHWGAPDRDGPLSDRPDGGARWVARVLSRQAHTAKATALAEHRSQHSALSASQGDEPVLTPALLEHFTGRDEVFCESAPADLPGRYFDRLYAHDADPWRIGRGFYEARKRELILACLPRLRFESAFEPGCAQGLLTVELARRCGRVLALDISDRAVAAARDRLAQYPNVEIRSGTIPEGWPEGRFDLVVVSELGYYLADPAELATRAHAALSDDGALVGCHWRHPAPGYPSSAQQVHDALGAGLHHAVHHVEADFFLDVWTVRALSVAQADGLVP